jgi:hypothetical protein
VVCHCVLPGRLGPGRWQVRRLGQQMLVHSAVTVTASTLDGCISLPQGSPRLWSVIVYLLTGLALDAGR